MKVRWTPFLTGLLLLCSLCVRAGVAQTRSSDAPLVFLHVTVINPGTSSVESDRAVTINGKHISAVSDAKNFHSPGHARIIDGSGQFLIPGLWDMHVHMAFGDWFPGGREIILPLLVANGVTGVRDMGGDVPVLFVA
jgi:predicted amidohydrolase